MLAQSVQVNDHSTCGVTYDLSVKNKNEHMKFIPFFAILLLPFTFSCGENNHTTPGDDKYVLDVKVLSSENVDTIVIDNFAHFISFDFGKGADLSNVELEITLAEGVTLVSPASLHATFNFNESPSIIVKANGKEITYPLKYTYYVPDFNPTDKGWVQSTDFGSLPAYLSVYKYSKDINGKSVQAYIAVANMNDANARFTILGEAKGYNTPTQFYQNNSQPKVVLNGGYFWDGSSLGLIIRNGVTIKNHQPMAYRTVNSVSTVYYPTTGVFGLNADGTFTTNWSYSTDAQTLYTYTSPSPNKTGETPQAFPSATFPTIGTKWTPKDAIGAGPILIKGGVYKNLWDYEMFDSASGIGATSTNPRSAIGYLPSGYLVIFVCEGRNMTALTPGLTLKNVADLFLELGCTEALNLDGGGSSCMLINGKETIKPSDGTQRKITNAVAIY